MPQFVDRHRQKRDRNLFPRGKQHIHLTLLGILIDLIRKRNEVVGHIPHGRDDYDNLIPGLFGFDHTFCNS